MTVFFLFNDYNLIFLLYYIGQNSRTILNKDGSGNYKESFNILLLSLMFASFL